ncbi:MAG: Gfo/Idh/MocA family oxidoreductase [Epulopiscium sp.]|nr:Gfo/Idh/MocA family oxidoreductase [Candidatus Epulonipiscium sp.]
MIKVALVGCGTMGRTHAQGYRNISNAQVVAVCDIQEEKGRSMAESLGAKYYSDYEKMLEEIEVDIVDLCIPTYMHKEFALKAMDLKRHVFCEKPLAITEEDGLSMITKAEEMGVKFSVGHVVRFFPAYKKAVETVETGRIGTPKLIRTTRNGAYPSWSWQDWYSNYECSGGPLLDLVIHDFDWIIHHFGDVERVFAKSLNGRIKGQDHCLVTLRLKNGLVAHVEGSWAYPTGARFGSSFEIVGTSGQIEYDSIESSSIKKQINDGHFVSTIENPLKPSDEPYTQELQEFINAVIEDRPPTITGSQALKALKVALAAIESSKTGKSVQL